MRSHLGKECRKLFRKMMEIRFPDFKEDKHQIVPPGRYVWTRQHLSGLWFHLVLIIHPTADKFTIDAAWDFDGKLPAILYGGAEGILERPLVFRMNFIWSGKDYWWPLVLRPEEFERVILYKDDPFEQCLPLVAPAVADAGQKIKEYTLPVFEKVAQLHGKKAAEEP